MLRECVALLRTLLGEGEGFNPNLLRPPTDMAKRRKSLVGKHRLKPRKAGRLKVHRPRTNRKRPPTASQYAIKMVQQARRKKDAAGMRYWNLKVARHTAV